MKTKRFLLFLFFLISGIPTIVSAQLSYTGFEGLADESVFNLASWTAQGFTVPWVNGFDVNRGRIDDAYSHSGTKSLRIFYPVGTFGPGPNGAQAPLMVTPASQYYISYWVRFSDTFSWGNTSEGGKLPGLAGGSRCSGCAVCTGSNGFSARLMWRPGGKLVLYLYHLDKVNPPCGDNLTLQLSGVDYYITKGQWFQVIERVKVNTGTNHDGEVELWINEQPALLVTGLQFVSNGDQVDAMYFSTFHGGSTTGWSPTVDSYTWFDDIKISTNSADVFTSLGLMDFDNNNFDGKTISKKSISISPHPLKQGDFFHIDISSFETSGNYQMEWIDVSGQLIYKEKVNAATHQYKVPALNKGLYILKIITDTEVLTKKVLVE